MAMFGGKEKPEIEKAKPAVKSSPAATSLSIVGAGMTIRGDLETDGVIKVEGSVEGHVKANSQVLVAKGGVVHGDIETTEAVIGGRVNGSIRGKERVEIQSGAFVEGDVITRRIAVAEGGTLNGQIRMGEDAWGREDRATDSKPADRVPSGALPARPSAPPAARAAIPGQPAPTPSGS